MLHPDRTRWHAAVLAYQTSRRWPDWPYEFALAAVDGHPMIHSAHFLVRPPAGWAENPSETLVSGASPDLVLERGLSPGQAMQALNEILGTMTVTSWGPTQPGKAQTNLELGAGIGATWNLGGPWAGLGDDLQIALTENSRVRFLCSMPRDGGLRPRLAETGIVGLADSWARSYVAAGWVQRILLRTLSEIDLPSEVRTGSWREYDAVPC